MLFSHTASKQSSHYERHDRQILVCVGYSTVQILTVTEYLESWIFFLDNTL